MFEHKINFGGIKENILIKKNIFQPNLTTQLSYETAINIIKNQYEVLDLGCGSGIIGIMIMKKFPNVKMNCSDVDSNSIDLTIKDFKKKKIKADIRKGDLLEVWSNKKFDYIINDVSGISSSIAKKSIWFSNNVPCDTGKDGSRLSVKIIKNSVKFLKKNGILQIPLISLSNIKKIIDTANIYFSEVKIHKSKDWFLPKEMESLKELMYKLKKLKYINFSEKFGKIVCNTAIAVCKGPKKK